MKLLNTVKNMKHKKLAISMAVGVVLTGAGVASAATIQNQVNSANTEQVVEQQEEPVKAVEIKEMKKIEEEPAKPVEAPQSVSNEPTAPVVTQSEPVEAPAQPQYKFAAEMAAAGIAEADYGLASDYLLDDNGWIRSGANAWSKASECHAMYNDIVACLTYANNNVKTYWGTWANARANWRTVQMEIDRYNKQQNQ
jgi:hypothetical protein